MASRLPNDRLPILRLRYRCQGSAGAAGKWREARVAGSWWHAGRDARGAMPEVEEVMQMHLGHADADQALTDRVQKPSCVTWRPTRESDYYDLWEWVCSGVWWG